jgi:hypothetical protein
MEEEAIEGGSRLREGDVEVEVIPRDLGHLKNFRLGGIEADQLEMRVSAMKIEDSLSWEVCHVKAPILAPNILHAKGH